MPPHVRILVDGSFVPYTVEPLYKGQDEYRPLFPCTVEPLYKGQVENRSLFPCTVEPLYKGQGPFSLVQWSLSTRDKLVFVPWKEVVLFLEVANVLSLWEVYNLSFVQRLSSFL